MVAVGKVAVGIDGVNGFFLGAPVVDYANIARLNVADVARPLAIADQIATGGVGGEVWLVGAGYAFTRVRAAATGAEKSHAAIQPAFGHRAAVLKAAMPFVEPTAAWRLRHTEIDMKCGSEKEGVEEAHRCSVQAKI